MRPGGKLLQANFVVRLYVEANSLKANSLTMLSKANPLTMLTMLTMLRPTLFRLPAAISPSSLRVLASAADSNQNFGLGAFVACAAFAGMLTSISAEIKHNHSLISADIKHNHSEVITLLDHHSANIRSDIKHNHSEVITKLDHNHSEVITKLDHLKENVL